LLFAAAAPMGSGIVYADLAGGAPIGGAPIADALTGGAPIGAATAAAAFFDVANGVPPGAATATADDFDDAVDAVALEVPVATALLVVPIRLLFGIFSTCSSS
jgi:hypothetical protein